MCQNRSAPFARLNRFSAARGNPEPPSSVPLPDKAKGNEKEQKNQAQQCDLHVNNTAKDEHQNPESDDGNS